MLPPRTRRSTGVLLGALLGAVLALCGTTSVRAASPRITLKLENVSAAEAVDAIEKASGIPMHLDDSQPKDTVRASFHWEAVPLAQVMRELGAQFRLRFNPGGPDGGYQVWQRFGAGQAQQLPPATEQTETERSLRLLHDAVTRSSGLRLGLHVQSPGADGEAIRGITGVCAKDDLGNVLVGRELEGRFGSFGASNQLPDEWIAGRGEPQLDLAEVTCEWKPVPEAVTALRITTIERGDLRALTTFRLTDLPLPDQTVTGVQPRVAGRPGQAPQPPERAFFDPEGGSLIGKVIVKGALVLNGDISYGLAPILPDKQVATRWMDVRLFLPDGSAKLEHVAPGTYRVLRVFQPEEAVELPRPGHWKNVETVVRIRAGKETTLPPLEWLPGPLPARLTR